MGSIFLGFVGAIGPPDPGRVFITGCRGTGWLEIKITVRRRPEIMPCFWKLLIRKWEKIPFEVQQWVDIQEDWPGNLPP
jgi:hypothetical protein